MAEYSSRYIVKPKLRKLLAKSKYKSQKEFAEIVGVKEPTISRFDSQTRYDITTLVAVSRALGVTIEDLFDIDEQLDLLSILHDSDKELGNNDSLPRDESYKIDISLPDNK